MVTGSTNTARIKVKQYVVICYELLQSKIKLNEIDGHFYLCTEIRIRCEPHSHKFHSRANSEEKTMRERASKRSSAMNDTNFQANTFCSPVGFSICALKRPKKKKRLENKPLIARSD